MGYYSKAHLCISNKIQQDVERLKVLGVELPTIFDAAVAESKGEFTYYVWDDLKWYDSYPWVMEFYDYIHTLQPKDYQFILIGEDNDIHADGHMEVMYPETTVDFF